MSQPQPCWCKPDHNINNLTSIISLQKIFNAIAANFTQLSKVIEVISLSSFLLLFLKVDISSCEVKQKKFSFINTNGRWSIISIIHPQNVTNVSSWQYISLCLQFVAAWTSSSENVTFFPSPISSFLFRRTLTLGSLIHCSVTLDGLIHKPSYEKLLEEPLLRFSGLYSEQCPSLMVKLQVYNNGEPFGLPVCTSYMPFENQWMWVTPENVYASTRTLTDFRFSVAPKFSWKEWVTLPVQYSDLPRTAMLALTILDCAGAGKTSTIGGTTIAMFGKNGMFRQVSDETIVVNSSMN